MAHSSRARARLVLEDEVVMSPGITEDTVFDDASSKFIYSDCYVNEAERSKPYKFQFRLVNNINYRKASYVWAVITVKFYVRIQNITDHDIYVDGTALASGASRTTTLISTPGNQDASGSFDHTWDVEVPHPKNDTNDVRVVGFDEDFICGGCYYYIAATWWPEDESYLIKKIATVDFDEEIKKTADVLTPDLLKKISSQPKEE